MNWLRKIVDKIECAYCGQKRPDTPGNCPHCGNRA